VVKPKSKNMHLVRLEESFKHTRRHNLKMNPKNAFNASITKLLGLRVHKKDTKINENKTKAILEVSPPSKKENYNIFFEKINFLTCLISNLSNKTIAFKWKV
jgi:hypothetical protein